MLQKIITFFRETLKFHKKKIGLFLCSTLVFFVVMFPLGDLADWVGTLIAKSTQNSVFLYFNDLGVAFFPAPGVIMNDVTIDLTQFSTVNADSLKVTPNLASLLAFRAGVRVAADNIFEGDLIANYKQGGKVPDSDLRFQNVDIDAENIELSGIQKFFSLPVEMSGQIKLNGEIEIDPSYREQPKGGLEVNIQKFKMPASTIMVPMAGTGASLPINLPEIKLASVEGVTQVSNGEILIDNLKFGDTSDVLRGRIKGRVALGMRAIGGMVRPEPGAYDLKIELDLKRERPSELNLMFAIIPDRYKAQTSNGQKYAFRLTGANFNAPPKFSDMGSF